MKARITSIYDWIQIHMGKECLSTTEGEKSVEKRLHLMSISEVENIPVIDYMLHLYETVLKEREGTITKKPSIIKYVKGKTELFKQFWLWKLNFNKYLWKFLGTRYYTLKFKVFPFI